MISGIQHFSFCRRQWALIHVENQWIENIHTTDGMIFHQRVHDDKQFEKLVDMFETYFKMGGMHYQLTYVSKEELLAAKKNPDKHRNLRVRVSGFSDYYVILDERIQDEIITRTEKR